MEDYRKIFKETFGDIPKDKNGRSYEIHHKDGNRNNNNIDNLMCVSIEDHYNIHYKQKDYKACLIIASRMKISPHDLSFLAKQQKVSENTKNKLRIAANLQFSDPIKKQKHFDACIAKNANHKNSIWINNGKENKRIYENELVQYLNIGFVKGRLLGEVKFYEHGNRNRDKFGRFTHKEK